MPRERQAVARRRLPQPRTIFVAAGKTPPSVLSPQSFPLGKGIAIAAVVPPST
jgi:hypothetical protein